MSSSKYADLPDIDTAPDIYETTEDAFPQANAVSSDSSDTDESLPRRSTKAKVDPNIKEELDTSKLMGAEEATKRFQRAEKRRVRSKTHYAYPPSPTSPSYTEDPSGGAPRPVSLSHRLKTLQSELSALETELADPSNPLLQKEREEDNVDPGELIRGLVDVRTRLDKIKKGKEGRARLVNVVLEGDTTSAAGSSKVAAARRQGAASQEAAPKSELQVMVEIDSRVGQLESVVGSSSTSLDESSPIPTPLLPLITKLNNQLAILSQPRHIDSISRRLKILLSDLDRASAAQHHGHRRQSSNPNGAAPPSALHDQLFPLLARLGPLLPHIPHILTRLRTLSALHSSATAFQTSLDDLEEEQKKIHNGLRELEAAVKSVEQSLDSNREVVKTNVAGLEKRVALLLERLEDIQHEDGS